MGSKELMKNHKLQQVTDMKKMTDLKELKGLIKKYELRQAKMVQMVGRMESKELILKHEFQHTRYRDEEGDKSK